MLLKIPAASDELVGRHVKGSKGTTWPHLRKVFGVFRRPGPVASYLLGYCNKLVRAVCEQRPVAMRLLLNDSPSILSGVLAKLRDDPFFELQLIVAGSHLSPEFGNTFEQIEADGFEISARVECLLRILVSAKRIITWWEADRAVIRVTWLGMGQ